MEHILEGRNRGGHYSRDTRGIPLSLPMIDPILAALLPRFSAEVHYLFERNSDGEN